MELRQKGVDGEAIEGVTLDMDDEAEAYRAAQRRARSLSTDEFERLLQEAGRSPEASGVRVWHGCEDCEGVVGGGDLIGGVLKRPGPLRHSW